MRTWSCRLALRAATAWSRVDMPIVGGECAAEI